MQDKAVDDNLAQRRLRDRGEQARGVPQVMERDYAKYGKLSDLFKTAK